MIGEIGVQDQGGKGYGRAVSRVTKSRIVDSRVDSRDHGGQARCHVYLFHVALIISFNLS